MVLKVQTTQTFQNPKSVRRTYAINRSIGHIEKNSSIKHITSILKLGSHRMLKRFITLVLSLAFFHSSAFNFMPTSPLTTPPGALLSFQEINSKKAWNAPPGALLSPFQDVNLKKAFTEFYERYGREEAAPSMYFTGAGIYLWWQLGAVRYMQENWDLEQLRNSIIMGASAGSVSATMLLLNADVEQAPKIAIKLAKDYGLFTRKGGLTGVCRELMQLWLNDLIKDDFDRNHLRNLQVAITTSRGNHKLVNSFETKEDLVECLLASCHVPVFMDGKPLTTCRGELCFDGSFWYFVSSDRHSGLPFAENVDKKKLLWVDYGDDEDFLQSISGNFLSLPTSSDKVYDMMDYGYNHMKREEYHGRTPFRTRNKVLSFGSSLYSDTIRKIPENIKLPKLSDFGFA